MWQAGLVVRSTHEDIDAAVGLLEEALSDPTDSLWGADLDDAVERLGALQATETVPLLVRTCEMTDGLSSIHDACGRALSMMGAAAVDALLDGHSRSADRDTRHTLEYALSELGVRDTRILALFLEVLDDDPDHGASLLTGYGDPAALPALEDALERFEFDEERGGPLAHHAPIELAAAIEALGGAVSDEGLVKLGKARQRGASVAKAMTAALAEQRSPTVERAPPPSSPTRPKMGRNERCWCGSGKKYKRCHLREDAGR